MAFNITKILTSETDKIKVELDDKRITDVVSRQDEVESSLNALIEEEVLQGVIATDIETKLNAKEQEYAPRLTKVELDIIEKTNHIAEVNMASRQGYYDGALVSFAFDDGMVYDWDRFKPIFESEGVPGCICIATDSIGQAGYLTLAQLKELKSKGWTVASHAADHLDANTSTEEQIDNSFKRASDTLKEHGLDYDIIVYPFGAATDTAIKVAKKYYKMGINIDREYLTNEPPKLSNYNMGRVAGLSQAPGTEPTLAECKAMVDDAIANKKYIIFEDHAAYAIWTQPKLEELRQLIQYIKSKNVPIVNFQDGFNMRCNLIETNNLTIFRNGVILDKGSQDFSYDVNTEIEKFPYGVTRTYFRNSQMASKGFPTVEGGTVTTIRVHNKEYPTADFYSGVQTVQEEVTGKTWVRYVGGLKQWLDWKLILQMNIDKTMPLLELTNNKWTAMDSHTSYPLNSITTFLVTGLNKAGFPGDQEGLVTTYRVGGYVGYYKQEFRPNLKNEIWSRRVNTSTGDWLSWELLTVLQGRTLFGEIGWNPIEVSNGASIISPDISVVGATFGDSVIPAAPFNLQGMVMTGYVKAANTVVIVLYNSTESPIDLAGGSFTVRVEKK